MINRRQTVLLFLGVFLTNISVIPFIKANSNFSNGLELGSQVYEVKKYDEVAWKNTINFTSNPRHWFGGEADLTGAKSKITIIELGYNDFISSAIFKKYAFSNVTLSLFPNVSSHGYDDTYINENFTYYYFVWHYGFHYWPFTTHEFDILSTFEIKHSTILRYPQNFTQIVDDYNDYASEINNDAILQSLNISFSILSGDNFMWQFIINRFAIGNPVNDYLTTMIGSLDCKNVTLKGNTLVFQKYGEKDYTLEVAYNKHGIMETILIKNSEGYIFYKITSSYPQTIFYVILGTIIFFIFGLAIAIIILKKIIRKKRTNF